MALESLIARLRTAANRPPSNTALLQVAHDAATAASTDFARVGVPVRAIVTQRGETVAIRLVQTGRITRRFGTVKPIDVLRRHVEERLPAAKRVIAAEAAAQLRRGA